MKHHPGLYDVHHNYQKKKERKKERLACNLMKNKNHNNKKDSTFIESEGEKNSLSQLQVAPKLS